MLSTLLEAEVRYDVLGNELIARIVHVLSSQCLLNSMLLLGLLLRHDKIKAF